MSNSSYICNHIIDDSLLSSTDCDSSTYPNKIATISQIWAGISLQITESNNIVAISLRSFNCLNSQDQKYILYNYNYITNKDGMFVADHLVPRVFLGPIEHFQSKRLQYGSESIPTLLNDYYNHFPEHPNTLSSIRSRQSSFWNQESPNFSSNIGSQGSSRSTQKRPPNSWILYRKSKHADTVLQNPNLPNCKISTLIARMWARESKEVRERYRALAESAKYQHTVDNPGYRYRPRKSSEVKRRQKKNSARVIDPMLQPISPAQLDGVSTQEFDIRQKNSEDVSNSRIVVPSTLTNTWTENPEINASLDLNAFQLAGSIQVDTSEIDFQQYFEEI